MSNKVDVLFCTSSQKKADELANILGDQFNVQKVTLDLPEIQGTPEEISIAKAKEAYKILNKPLIVEDTCLCFNAFNGLPGPYIKHFISELGGLGLTKLLSEFDDKTSYALCVFTYIDENSTRTFIGKHDGTIVKPRGTTTFGWDNIFEPEGSDKTYGEMTVEMKSKISHRYRAATKLKNRAIRELPWKSRYDILKERIKPRYMDECVGTPRREYQVNVINNIRIAPTFNPYVKLNKEKRYRLDNWPSRNWDDWNPSLCYLRGGRKRYSLPKSILPIKDELGESHPPRLSGRYKADIKKQFYFNALPWIWDINYYTGRLHYHDRNILEPKVWYKYAYRKNIMDMELKNIEKNVNEYRQETRLRKRLTYLEKAVVGIAGEELSSKYIRQRKIPKVA